MGFEHCARTGPVNYPWDAAFHVQAHIGVQRGPQGGNRLTEQGFAVFLERLHQGLVTRQGLHGARQQKSANIHRDLPTATRRIKTGSGLRYGLAQGRFHVPWVFFRNHAAIDLEGDCAGNDIGVGAAGDLSDIQVGVGDARDRRADLQVVVVERVQRVENMHRRLQGVGAAVGNGGMRHVAVHGDFKLQTTVVRHHHLVAETGGQQQVRFGQSVIQQPVGAHHAAVLFVVGEVQFHAA